MASSKNFSAMPDTNKEVRGFWLWRNKEITAWDTLTSQSIITQKVFDHKFDGSGTRRDPYQVEWIDDDATSPLQFYEWRKWMIVIVVGMATLAISFTSSVYSGSVNQVIEAFGTTAEIATLGTSLYVLGFCIGPMFWAPLSELYGRQYIFIITLSLSAAFQGGAAASQNLETLLIMRFLAGATGASAVVNSAGVISDIFSASERGLALLLFGAGPFLGPVMGVIVGSFLGEYEGWRAVEILAAAFCGAMTLFGCLTIPETYTPILLRKRAQKLSHIKRQVYTSKLELDSSQRSAKAVFKRSMIRPWVMLVYEPIALCINIYVAIIYGTLYLSFSAFPVVFEGRRGWSQSIASLSFLGIGIGQIIAMLVYYFISDKFYRQKLAQSSSGFLPPEERLKPAMFASIMMPIGLFWFAWTTSPSVPWLLPILGCVPFGFGQILMFLAVTNYLIDAYTLYAASALASNSLLRALFGAVFPLITTYMYDRLGTQWATSIPAFLALACVPFPFIFFKYGAKIRAHCKYTAEAGRMRDKMVRDMLQKQHEQGQQHKDEEKSTGVSIFSRERPLSNATISSLGVDEGFFPRAILLYTSSNHNSFR